ncbi:MAG: cobalamin biosynthesis protein CobD [Tissierella sp.]|nr:cobalamin biosynthesis protein CobD [Tissierella sp.]
MINLIVAVILDFIVGDPYSFPHPVKLMGRIIGLEEKLARRISKSHVGLKIMGLIIVCVNVFLGFFIPFILLKLKSPYKIPYRIVNIYLIYTCIAARSLHYEANMVQRELEKGIVQGRKRLSYIVGRDTSNLDKEEIIKATVETVSENTSDGVIGPLFYIVLLGAPGGLAYKFINTMDSMLGYMNDKYRDIGYFPAKVDDLFNLIPARLTAILMNISSIGRFDFINGMKILKRDKRNHKSPNSGYPESATAGLLGIQLGGGNYYHGIYVDKPHIGDKINKVNKRHIKDSVEIMYRSEIAFLMLVALIIFLRSWN